MGLADHVSERVGPIAPVEGQRGRLLDPGRSGLIEQHLILTVLQRLVGGRVVQERFIHACTICLADDSPVTPVMMCR